jgi:hypothetical protein
MRRVFLMGLSGFTALALIAFGCEPGIPSFHFPGGPPACGGSIPITCCHEQGITCGFDAECCAGTACLSGVCNPCGPGTCDRCGLTTCPGVETCVDLTMNVNNCGACGHACEPTQVCNQGTCECPTGTADRCDAGCLDPHDLNNCGMCGNSCLPGNGGNLPPVCCGDMCTTNGNDDSCGSSCASCFAIPCTGGVGHASCARQSDGAVCCSCGVGGVGCARCSNTGAACFGGSECCSHVCTAANTCL